MTPTIKAWIEQESLKTHYLSQVEAFTSAAEVLWDRLMSQSPEFDEIAFGKEFERYVKVQPQHNNPFVADHFARWMHQQLSAPLAAMKAEQFRQCPECGTQMANLGTVDEKILSELERRIAELETSKDHAASISDAFKTQKVALALMRDSAREFQQERDAARAEVARLREALKDVTEVWAVTENEKYMQGRAAQALEKKP